MTFLSRLFRRREVSVTGALARQRFGATMPGETAALAGNRYGLLVA